MVRRLARSRGRRLLAEEIEAVETLTPDGRRPAPRHESPRPVVTYMLRNNFRRSVLNTHDILTYLLLRYNVTLRVTTFEVSGSGEGGGRAGGPAL